MNKRKMRKSWQKCLHFPKTCELQYRPTEKQWCNVPSVMSRRADQLPLTTSHSALRVSFKVTLNVHRQRLSISRELKLSRRL